MARSFAPFTLRNFLAESNRIEGIRGVSIKLETEAERFLALSEISRQNLIDFVSVAQPNAVIRDREGLNVRVGDHIAPPGGERIVAELDLICRVASEKPKLFSPYDVHVAYETLHPFTDGNGRSGRILWLWMMGGIERAPLGFLHHFYYQTLSASRCRPAMPPHAAGGA